VISLRILLAVGPSFAPGKSAYEQGRMQEAIGLLDRAVREAPDEADPYLYRALTREELGDANGARADFERTLVLRPDSAMGHYFFGDLLLSANELDAAELHLRRALEIDPAYAWARYRMGDLLQKRGKFAEAVAAYQASANEDPSGGGWHAIGDLWLERGDRRRAAEAFEKDLLDHPECYEARVNAAAVYLGDGDPWRAVEHYAASLRYHPGDTRAEDGLRRARRSIELRWLMTGGIPALGVGLLIGALAARLRRRSRMDSARGPD
jgi:tetratricopeptide (TPR) repeat protein